LASPAYSTIKYFIFGKGEWVFAKKCYKEDFMPPKVEKGSEAIVVSSGVKVDAGGFIIVNGKIIKIPPRGPEFEKIMNGAHLLSLAEGISDKESRKKIETLGEELLIEGTKGLK
jgi:hypothetical protein